MPPIEIDATVWGEAEDPSASLHPRPSVVHATHIASTTAVTPPAMTARTLNAVVMQCSMCDATGPASQFVRCAACGDKVYCSAAEGGECDSTAHAFGPLKRHERVSAGAPAPASGAADHKKAEDFSLAAIEETTKASNGRGAKSSTASSPPLLAAAAPTPPAGGGDGAGAGDSGLVEHYYYITATSVHSTNRIWSSAFQPRMAALNGFVRGRCLYRGERAFIFETIWSADRDCQSMLDADVWHKDSKLAAASAPTATSKAAAIITVTGSERRKCWNPQFIADWQHQKTVAATEKR